MTHVTHVTHVTHASCTWDFRVWGFLKTVNPGPSPPHAGCLAALLRWLGVGQGEGPGGGAAAALRLALRAGALLSCALGQEGLEAWLPLVRTFPVFSL